MTSYFKYALARMIVLKLDLSYMIWGQSADKFVRILLHPSPFIEAH